MIRALVVDDNDTLAHLLVTLLTTAGHEAIEVSGEAHRLLDPSDSLWGGVNVLITDLSMPGIDGLDILTVAALYHKNIHRLVLTGYDPLPDSPAHALAHRVLLKPSDVLDIVRVVESLEGPWMT